MGEIPLRQGTIVLVPFPFSDQTDKKVRPALVVSNDRFNSYGDDVLVCAITSNRTPSQYSVFIDHNDIERGVLYDKSAIRADSLLKIEKNLIIKTIARIRRDTFIDVLRIITDIVQPSRN